MGGIEKNVIRRRAKGERDYFAFIASAFARPAIASEASLLSPLMSIRNAPPALSTVADAPFTDNGHQPISFIVKPIDAFRARWQVTILWRYSFVSP